MKPKTKFQILQILFCTALIGQGNLVRAGQADANSRAGSFDAGWLFQRGDAQGAEEAAFNDASWRKLDVPHDWSIEDAPPRAQGETKLTLPTEGWRFTRGDDLNWASPSFSDSSWQTVSLPASFGSLGYTNSLSMGWYRRVIAVPDTLRGKDFLLEIGVVDDADETFFNGQKIGGLGGMPPNFSGEGSPWTQLRSYRVPASLVRAGENVVAVRVFNNNGDGGIMSVPLNFDVVGPFSPESAGDAATGHTLGGTGWYRKHFTLGAASIGKHTAIVFDGVYMDSDMWLNGHHLGNHPYGYTAFAYELTPFLKPAGQENILSVRVRNVGKTSRWYSGSGIYRHVTLMLTEPLHIPNWGVVVTTPQVTKQTATVKIVTKVENARVAKSEIKLRVKLFGPNGRGLGEVESAASIVAQGSAEIPLSFEVKSPPLWSPESPQLCRAEVQVVLGDTVIDQTTTTFGIREICFSVEKGFTLNGQPLELRGACLHHDNGPLGAAAIDRAEQRRVELMKAQGYNAFRTSHNPPSTAFLDACDRLGMLVMEEAFDCWEKGKNPDDYSKYFKDWWQRDLDAMILRDRTHPSVILWSIGNEIPQRADPEGYVIAKNLADEVRRLDPTRPVTEGVCNFWDQPGRPWSDTATAFTFLDVGGYNYEPGKYEADHETFPNRIMVGTESYPKEICDYWRLVEKHPYVIGDFVWTGMDYLGESGCGNYRLDDEKAGWGRGWPWFNAFCGDLDICGFKKPQAAYRDVVWGRSQLELAVHRPLPPGRSEILSGWGWPDELASWTWPGAEGKSMQVSVYSSGETIRLELNGKKIAEKQIGESDKLTAKFELPYAPGELKAIALKQGKVVATKSLRTAGEAKKIRLVADRRSISSSRNDLAYVTVEVADAAGDLLPDANVAVKFSVSGAGELAAVGSGSPSRPESFRGPVRTTWHGRALAILRPTGSSGKIRLHAEAAGLEGGNIEVFTK